MRILCIRLPHFPLRCECQRYPELAGHTAAITFSEGSQTLLLDHAPGLKGLQRDMPLQQAISLYGDIEVFHADMPYYWSVFNGILDALELKSPLVEGADLGEIYIGVDGLHLIYASDYILTDAMRKAIPPVFEPQLGIASGKFTAYIAAIQSPPGGYKVLTGNIAASIQGLPCDVLPISIKSKARLHEFGLHTLGRLAIMSPAHLQAQFGLEGQLIWELSNGQDDTPLYPRLTEQSIEEATTLPSVTVSLDLLLMALEDLLSKAFVKLGQRNMGMRSITIWTRSWVSEHWEQNIRFKEPAMNAKIALSRIRQIMENTPQPGPIEQLGVKVTGTGRPHGKQRSLISQVRAQEQLLEEIKQLELRLGSPQLFQLKEVEPWSRIPERRYTLAPLSR